MLRYRCPRCGKTYKATDNAWECECGSVLELAEKRIFDPSRIDPQAHGLWRYAATLPAENPGQAVTLGEGWTPLVPFGRDQHELLLKLESTNPTGSYKDRGATVMTSVLREAGIREVVEDSSGNAGAALAAYCARAGIRCHIFAPAGNSSPKLRQIQAYGADLLQVPGSRSATARAALQAGRSSYYASHAHSPLYIEGCKTIAYEIWEQLGGAAPTAVFTPVGQGSIFLGLYTGFQDLASVGLIERIPSLYGVQAQACAPLAGAFEQGLELPEAVEAGETLAEGIKIGAPVRGAALLAAARSSGGAFLAVAEEAIACARSDLAHQGVYVEATSAVSLAGLRARGEAQAGSTVLILTGSGLKTG